MIFFTCIPRFRPSIGWNILWAALKTIAGNRLPQEEGGNSFEESFATYIGSAHAVQVPSGRIGLYSILKCLGLNEGSEVILPAFTYWAIPEVVRSLKMVPIFVDINPHTCNMDPDLLEAKITPDTKVIVPTHLYGLPCDMNKIMLIAKKYNLIVIEDCVQSLGARFEDKMLGCIGHASYFSFDMTKNMPLLGGGMVVTNDDGLAKKIKNETLKFSKLHKIDLLKRITVAGAMKLSTGKIIFTYLLYPLIFLMKMFKNDLIEKIFSENAAPAGKLLESHIKIVPYSLQNVIGSIAIKEINRSNTRRLYAGNYLLAHMNTKCSVVFPSSAEGHIFSSFVIKTKNREGLAFELLKKGIDTTKGYLQPFGDDCQNAKLLEKEILHLPLYPSLRDDELSHIARAFNQIIEKRAVT